MAFVEYYPHYPGLHELEFQLVRRGLEALSVEDLVTDDEQAIVEGLLSRLGNWPVQVPAARPQKRRQKTHPFKYWPGTNDLCRCGRTRNSAHHSPPPPVAIPNTDIP